MDVKNWYKIFSTRSRSIRLGRYYHDEKTVLKESFCKTRGTKSSIWKVLWKKMSKEKKEMNKRLRFESPKSVNVQVPRYDKYTYSQNFDNGFNWDEPRSFSLRFADPSKLLLK